MESLKRGHRDFARKLCNQPERDVSLISPMHQQQNDDNDDNDSDNNDNDEDDGNDNGDNDEKMNTWMDYEPPLKMRILPPRLNHRIGCNR